MATTFHTARRAAGSNATKINVDRDGRPFGQLWTFANTASEWHGWHAQKLSGEYRYFEPADLSDTAKKVAGFDAMAWMNAA